MSETAPPPDNTAALPESARPDSSGRPLRAPLATYEQVFDAGETLLDDGILRANWAVPWSDLMMTMFVLFAALLAVQTIHGRVEQQAQKQKTMPVQELAALQAPEQKTVQAQEPKTVEIQEQIVERDKPVREEVLSRKASFEPLMQVNVLARSQEAVREANLQNAEIVLMDDQSVKVSVQGPMFFALGKTELRPEVMQFLDRLAQIIRQTPYEVHVVGHTDDLPISTAMFPTNWELSLVRASHVARYLINSGHLVPSRFLVMGRGEYGPVATNADERSRALNRRVEIIITRIVTESEGARR
jgi:chemotaxis protein MotB